MPTDGGRRPLLTVPLALRRWADRIGFTLLSAAIVGGGFVQGSSAVALSTWPLVAAGGAALVTVNAVVACMGFAATLALSAVVLVAEMIRDGRAGDRLVDGPRVAAVVPVYGDATALDRSVGSLLASAYENLHVYVVCEPGDDATLERARSLAEHGRVHRLVNTETPGSKAAAVNYAAEATESAYIGVFDADERVHPQFVAAAAAGLERHDVFQGRTLPRPEGILESVVYYESIVLGYLSHRLITLLTRFRMATSNVVVMRREAFERVGGYDPTMLTEDFDFAFRCYEAGVTVRETMAYPSEIEAAHTLVDWWGQRKRWMTGYAQVFHRRLGSIRFERRSAFALLVCAGAIAANLFLLSLVSQMIVLAVFGPRTVLLILAVTVWGVALTVRWLDVRAGNVDGVGVGWLVLPIALPLYSLAAIKGVVEYPISWRGEWYRVRKEG